MPKLPKYRLKPIKIKTSNLFQIIRNKLSVLPLKQAKIVYYEHTETLRRIVISFGFY